MLRRYQQDCLDQCLIDHGLCILPTGAGKSHIIAELAYQLKRPQDTLILTPRVELVKQNKQKLKNDATVCTINLAYTRAMYKSILIIDEAHLVRYRDGMYQKMIRNADVVYGFTATPYRMDHGFLVPLIFKKVLYEIKREELTPTYLTPRRFVDIPQHLLINVKNNFSSLIKLSEQVCPQTEQCINHFLKVRKGKSLIFGCDIKHCEMIKILVPKSGIVHSKLSKKVRDKVIQDFRDNKISTLINCEILTAGFDDPMIENVCILRPTDSYTLHEQILGRGDRVYLGKNFNHVYDYTLNSFNFESKKQTNLERYCIFCMKLTDYRLSKCSHCDMKLVKGEPPTKECYKCKYKNFTVATYCKNCGEFIRKNVNRITANSFIIWGKFIKIKGVHFSINKEKLKEMINTLHTDCVLMEKIDKDKYELSNLKEFIVYWKKDYMSGNPKIIKLRVDK